MHNYYDLTGDDWKLTGWKKNQWKLQDSIELGESIEAAVNTISAEVPGAVQVDLMRENILHDPNYGLNSRYSEWVNNREWFYDKEFIIPDKFKGEKYILCFEGLDYHGEIHFNGNKVRNFSGMFKPLKIDITDQIKFNKKNKLRIIFYDNPEIDGQIGYTNRIQKLKSRFNYGWDWIPRIVPVGIWDDVYIKVYNNMQINDFFPGTQVNDNLSSGKINMNLNLEVNHQGNYTFKYTIFNNENKKIKTTKENLNFRAAEQQYQTELFLDDIKLWWPQGHGDQPLYKIEVEIFNENGQKCDFISKKVGFKKIDFKQNHNAPENSRPYTLYINNKRIFMKGVNWVPISPFYGKVNKEEYKKYLKRFKDMNCNLLRVWGGAILEKEDFYNICDKMGLLVWQEFPQSSSGINNTPNDDPDYLEELKKVARVYIKKRRHHVSHIIWCGGNELLWEDMTPVDERHANLNMLSKLVKKMDPDKYFLPASSSGPTFTAEINKMGEGLHHDVHGPWRFAGVPDHYQYFNKDDSLFRTETGCPGITRLETLKKYSRDFKLWPPDRSNPYWEHRGAWWVQLEQLTELFGEWDDKGNEINQYVKASRFLQAEALRYAVESLRRREPETSGFIIWMGNEPFPNNANTSLIEYDGTPKPAYHWVRKAYSSEILSARYSQIKYDTGDKFESEIYLTIQDKEDNHDFNAKAQILDPAGNCLQEKEYNIRPQNFSNKLGVIEWEVEDNELDIFFLRLKLFQKGKLIHENTYIFTINSSIPFAPLRNLPESNVILKSHKNIKKWIIKNNSDIPAVGIFLYEKVDNFVDINPNYLTLMPGEEKKLTFSSEIKKNEIVINGINFGN